MLGQNVEIKGKLKGGITGKGWTPGRSGNPGGRPKSRDFRPRCQNVAFRFLESFQRMSDEQIDGLPVLERVNVLTVLADRAGMLSAAAELSMLLKVLASPSVGPEQRQSLIEAYKIIAGNGTDEEAPPELPASLPSADTPEPEPYSYPPTEPEPTDAGT